MGRLHFSSKSESARTMEPLTVFAMAYLGLQRVRIKHESDYHQPRSSKLDPPLPHQQLSLHLVVHPSQLFPTLNGG